MQLSCDIAQEVLGVHSSNCSASVGDKDFFALLVIELVGLVSVPADIGAFRAAFGHVVASTVVMVRMLSRCCARVGGRKDSKFWRNY